MARDGPAQKFLVTDSREPAASASKEPDGQKPADADLSVRVLRRDSGQVMLVSRAPSTFICPSTPTAISEVCARAATTGCWI